MIETRVESHLVGHLRVGVAQTRKQARETERSTQCGQPNVQEARLRTHRPEYRLNHFAVGNFAAPAQVISLRVRPRIRQRRDASGWRGP